MINNRKGFTLIELLIVVVIIGILAAIAIPKFSQTKDKAKVAAAKSEVKNLMTSMESYYTDHNTYTTSLAALQITSATTSSGVDLAITAGGDAGYTVTGTVATAAGNVVCTSHVGNFAVAANVADGAIACTTPTP